MIGQVDEAFTIYKIDYTAVDENPDVLFKRLKRLVGERGFEPPTPWSRTRFKDTQKSVEICCVQVIGVEPVVGHSLTAIDFCLDRVLSRLQNRLQCEET